MTEEEEFEFRHRLEQEQVQEQSQPIQQSQGSILGNVGKTALNIVGASNEMAGEAIRVAREGYPMRVPTIAKGLGIENKYLTSQDKPSEFVSEITSGIQGLTRLGTAALQGKNPLQTLGDYFTNLGKQIAAAAIEAAVFQGIMMLLNPASAGSFGGGFFEGFKKILGFAEGGIVSQPTIAMVGEGGQSEAIMPLNKLGNMMNSTFNAGAMSGGGAGNGQFVLKGNDLVLALQRSNYSLNLRRGA